MTYYNDILCCTADEIMQFCSESNYKALVHRNKINKVRRACKGTPALIEFSTLPLQYKEELIKLNGGSPEKTVKHQQFADEIQLDMDAVSFYQNYKMNGSPVKPEKQRQLANEASILNAIAMKLKAHLKRQSSGSSQAEFWKNAAKVLPGIKTEWPHKLPISEKFLKKKFFAYVDENGGYRSLINGNYGNQNTRKVNENLESLLRFIFAQSWKPNHEDVYKDYMKFINGVKILVNENTAEIYNPNDYEPISVSTVRSYMKKWSNAIGTEKKRSNSRIGYNAKHRSYADLIVDKSGSILSMDDRDMPFRLKGTTKRVVGYFTSDACSGAIIGWAFARPKMRDNDPHGKGINLVMDCFRNTFEQLSYYDVKMPAEVEVENHLMSTLKETTLKQGNLFQFVRYAAAENPQEKSIEGFFRVLRYKYDRKIKGFRARPHARSEANQARPGEENVEYSFDEICEIVIDNILEYNNDLHPNQKKFPGKTRIEVFLENQHPALLPINWRDVARWVGHSVTTSVNRGEVRANNQKFLLPTPELMDKTGYGSDCTAYWFKHEGDQQNTIYLYKNDEFVCTLSNKPQFHKARIEQTSEDFKAMSQMQSFTKKIDDQAKSIIAELNDNKVTFIKTNVIENAVQVGREIETFEDTEPAFDYTNIQRENYDNSLINEL
jgi:hypothetical protein